MRIGLILWRHYQSTISEDGPKSAIQKYVLYYVQRDELFEK